MGIKRMSGAVAITAISAVAFAMPAHALDLSAIIGQSLATAERSLATGLTDTAESLSQNAPAHNYLSSDPDRRAIVILGARINRDGTLPEILNARLDTAAAISRAHPTVPVIVSGGATESLPYTEAEAMLAGLALRGVNPANVITEGDSGSTVENANNTTRILDEIGVDGAVIVSSDSHVDRAESNFQDADPSRTYVKVGAEG